MASSALTMPAAAHPRENGTSQPGGGWYSANWITLETAAAARAQRRFAAAERSSWTSLAPSSADTLDMGVMSADGRERLSVGRTVWGNGPTTRWRRDRRHVWQHTPRDSVRAMGYRTIIEPFRIKSVEPLRFTTREERRAALEAAGWNLFALDAEDVLVDLLTDSGTGAMSSAQWAELMRGDESYAGSSSFARFESVVAELTGYRHVIPTHQGRAAERILFSETVGSGDVVPNNTHFDTTRANVEAQGAQALDLPCSEAADLQSEAPFKGDMDVEALRAVIGDVGPERVPLVMMTLTNNSGGGQPVSLRNLREVRAVCDAHEIPLVLDAARFADNAWFVTQREHGQADRTPREVAREAFAIADGCTVSLKKDGLGNIGGLLALDDDDLAERCRAVLVLTEGFPTYGGLAGRDLDALAQGLRESTDHDYLRYRARTAEYLSERAWAAGVPTVRPPGGHAVYLDARSMLGHIPPHEYPAHALACALYLEGGVRGVEIGTLMFGRPGPDGRDEPAPRELVRLALPRRVYTQSHVDYVGGVIAVVAGQAEALSGYRIVSQPEVLRHFTARLEPLSEGTPTRA